MTGPAELQPATAQDHDTSAGVGEDAGGLPLAPDMAGEMFGARLPLAQRYAELLAGDGVAHGHIGPREVARLWDRHLINSALVTELLPVDAVVLDVGSGAGLPGLPIAIRRPDIQVVLLEPMLRRSAFLSSCVSELGLDAQVSVTRGRAEDRVALTELGTYEWLVARAVAPLDRLSKWCLPLLAPGGLLLAMKGSSAADEVVEHRAAVLRLGADEIHTTRLGDPTSDESTWVVMIRRGVGSAGQRRKRRR